MDGDYTPVDGIGNVSFDAFGVLPADIAHDAEQASRRWAEQCAGSLTPTLVMHDPHHGTLLIALPGQPLLHMATSDAEDAQQLVTASQRGGLSITLAAQGTHLRVTGQWQARTFSVDGIPAFE